MRKIHEITEMDRVKNAEKGKKDNVQTRKSCLKQNNISGMIPRFFFMIKHSLYLDLSQIGCFDVNERKG